MVSGDMTGILRGRIYSYIPVLVAFDETWCTPSSDTVLLDFDFGPTLNNKGDSKFSMQKKHANRCCECHLGGIAA